MSDFNLGTVTAYGYAKDKGYTGTEDEFAALMASYADVAEQAAESAEQAAASATTATTKASEASDSASAASASKTAAQNAQSSAESAATTATTKASEASNSASTATTKAGEATTAAGTATTAATSAAGSATTATTKAGEAATSATTAAEAAQRAEDAAATLVIDDTLTHAGQAADAKKTGDEIGDLKDGLIQIATFGQGQDEIVWHKSDLLDSYDSTYVNNGSISDNGNFSASTSYRTYYVQAEEALSIWIENNPESAAYLSVSVYGTTISRNTFVARYRNSDQNLPTESNKLSIASNQWLAITFGYSSAVDRDFNLYTGLYNSISTDPIPTDEFMQAINDRIYIGKATKTATSMTVDIGKIRYEINKYSNSTIRAYMWRTNACRILDDNGVYQTVWANSDSDGVVKIRGESDFIGGYHGDETETLFHLFIDGVEYAEDSAFTDLEFNEIVLYFESDVFHCNTSATPDVVAFKRNKIIKFNNEGYTVENYWVAQENLTCEISYIGMLSVENGLVNAYHTNGDFKYHALDTGIARSADITDVCFNTPYGDVGIKVSEAKPNTNYGCVVSPYTGRLKVYASNFNSSAHGALSSGDVLKGKAVTYFRG